MRYKIAHANKQILFMLTLVAATFMACQKDKIAFEYDDRMVTEAMEPSAVRIVNLAQKNQVVVNGKDTLTNYIIKSPGDDSRHYPGTRYFPADGRLGTTWYVPRSLLDRQGKASITFDGVSTANPDDYFPIQLEVMEDYREAQDYYLTLKRLDGTLEATSTVIPRDVSAPSRPDHVKIRLINLSAPGARDGFEDIFGPMSLVWADGTEIDERLNDIVPSRYSEYIELPYGTYQFKVLTTERTQVSGVWGRTALLNPSVSTMSNGGSSNDSGVTFAPIYSFKPGGVYSIVVAPEQYTYPYPLNPSESLRGYQNGFRIITDIEEPTNRNYARVQFVNVLPQEGDAAFLLNRSGNDTPDHLAYMESSTVQHVLAGNGEIEIRTADEVITETLHLEAGMNYTVWLFQDGQKPGVRILNNQLGGERYLGVVSEDASYDQMLDIFHLKTRFLNLNPAYPYITFTGQDGQPLPGESGAQENLQPGQVVTAQPYLRAPSLFSPMEIMAYESRPGFVPGYWAREIQPLMPGDFIARPELYVRGVLPPYEPGTYTVALIGKDKSTGKFGPRLFVLKHTK